VEEFAVRIEIIPWHVATPVYVGGAVFFDPCVFLVVAIHVALEVEREVFGAGLAEGAGHVLHPGALRIPPTLRAQTEMFLVGALGKFARPIRVLFGDVGHDRMGVGGAHELAQARCDERT
jgi:hypothetical protein